MPLPEYEPDDITGGTLHVLRTVLRNFSVSPLRSGKRVRDLLAIDYFQFRAAAITIFREPVELMDVRGLRYLITLLWTNDLLIGILGDVSLPKELSVSIAQIAVKVDTQFHIRLIRFLVAGMLDGREVDEKSANRLLEVLGFISDGVAIQGFLRQMLRHPNPRIRSKITLLVGHGGRASSAIRKILSDPEEDARVRANAIEALWSHRDPEIVSLFREMLGDANNRVAGNAVLGLYLAGDPQAIPLIRSMAARAETAPRQTAAWVMGKTEDPRFLPDVGRLLGQPDQSLRKSVFQAIALIKSAASRRLTGPQLMVTVTDAVHNENERIQVRLTVSSSATGETVDLPPTGFATFLEGKPVEQFSCVERRNSEFCAAFVFPRRSTQADPLRAAIEAPLAACLEKKRIADRWVILRYQESSAPAASASFRMFGQTVEQNARAPEKKNSLAPTLNSATLRSELESSAPRSENAAHVFEAISRVVNAMKFVRSARYVLAVVDSDQEVDSHSVEDLLKTVKAGGISINAISTRKNTQIEQLCRQSMGIFRLVPDIAGVEQAVRMFYQSFQSEYLVEFTASGATTVSVQVHNSVSRGETTLDLTQRAPDPAAAGAAPAQPTVPLNPAVPVEAAV